MNEKVTIRTSTGQLFGAFDSREEAWAVVERIRRSDQYESVRGVHGAAVVPLLDGVTPKPIHPGWLSDGSEGAQGDNATSLTQRELDTAVDTFVGAYNSSRSAHLHHHYASAYIVASDQHLRAAVSAVLAPVLAEVDRLAEHSKTLNAVAFAIAEALGDVPPGADQVEGNPIDQVGRLIGTLERRTAQLEAARAELDAARARIAELGELL